MAQKRKHNAVLVADMSSPEHVERAKKAKTMIAHTGFDMVRLIDVSRVHSGFAVIDNADEVERCFALFDPSHPNARLINGDIHWINADEIDKAATMPAITGAAMTATRQTDDELEPLRAKFAVIAGKEPDRRWKKDRLLKEIEAEQSVAGMAID